MEEPKRTLSREELHDLVWSTPIQKLAQRYGISDRGLAKTCERHLVPVPGRGHWAKVEAGQPSKRSPLRAVENSALHTVYIGGKVVTAQSRYVSEALTVAKLEMERDERKLVTKPLEPTPNTDLGTSETSTPTRPLDPDVKTFLAELRKAPSDRDGFVSLKYVKVHPSDIERVGRILNRLTTELKQYDFALSFATIHGNYTTNRLGFTKDGSTVDFGITAPRKRVVEKSRWGYESFSHKHVGRLAFQIFGPAEGTPKNWADTEVRKIEQSLEKIVESFRINVVVERERNEKQRAEDARRKHLAHRRQLAALRIKREDDRLKFLHWIADTRREVDDLRGTIAAVPLDGDLPPDYMQMIAWARKRLADLEQQTAVERIQSILIERQLYADPDDLFDQEGEPPPKKNSWDD